MYYLKVLSSQNKVNTVRLLENSEIQLTETPLEIDEKKARETVEY